METIAAARVRVKLWYNDKDISASIEPMLVAFEYTDYASGQVDDIQVMLKDPDGRWLHELFPEEGSTLKAKIVWSEGSIQKSLPCGVFTIDAPEYDDPPGIVSLKGTAASVTTSIRRDKKTKRFENITLKQLASKIAAEQNVSIFFRDEDTPPLAKVEQKDESDLAFLLRQCQREGYALSVDTSKSAGANQLVIRKRVNADSAESTMILKRHGGIVEKCRFGGESLETYRACEVKYKHPDKGLLTYTYIPPNAPNTGQVLTVRKHAGDLAEAIRMAKAELELANRERVKCDMTCTGTTDLVSGIVVTLSGWGKYDGRYAVDEAKHTINPAYKTGLYLVKVFS
ncbi:MAG: contractile injection system protein, VgrG/Pvc8 family [Armatimonadota bacterium]|nr:hypothetical protein [bacterium]